MTWHQDSLLNNLGWEKGVGVDESWPCVCRWSCRMGTWAFTVILFLLFKMFEIFHRKSKTKPKTPAKQMPPMVPMSEGGREHSRALANKLLLCWKLLASCSKKSVCLIHLMNYLQVIIILFPNCCLWKEKTTSFPTITKNTKPGILSSESPTTRAPRRRASLSAEPPVRQPPHSCSEEGLRHHPCWSECLAFTFVSILRFVPIKKRTKFLLKESIPGFL